VKESVFQRVTGLIERTIVVLSVTTLTLLPDVWAAETATLTIPLNRSAVSEEPIFEIALPGESGKRKFFPISENPLTVQIPLYGPTLQKTSEITQRLIVVSDLKDLYGVLAPSSEGYFGTLVNNSSKEPYYFQISPKNSSQPKISARSDSGVSHSISRIEAAELNGQSHCGDELSALSSTVTKTPETLAMNLGRSVNTSAAWREVELFSVSSAEFSGTRTDEVIAAQISSTVAASNLFFEQLELKLSVKGIQILREGTDPFAAVAARNDAYELFYSLEDTWNKELSISRDAVVFFGTSKFNGIYGLARTGSSCSTTISPLVFATQGGSGATAELSLSATLAHELGHIVGMSHDPTYYPSGPSLMYPSFVINPGGFSAFSTEQFRSHAGAGQLGGLCFNSVPTPAGIQFDGGNVETVRLREGQTFRREIKLAGGESIARFRSVSSLSGISFKDGVVEFTPDFNIANQSLPISVRRFDVDVELEDGRLGRKQIFFEIVDSNRAPVIVATSTQTKFKSGQRFVLTLRASDPDGDKVAFTSNTLRALKALRGSKNIRVSGNTLKLTWNVPVSYKRSFSLNAAAFDDQGSVGRTRFRFLSAR